MIPKVASELSITNMDSASKADRCRDSRGDAAHFRGVEDLTQFDGSSIIFM